MNKPHSRRQFLKMTSAAAPALAVPGIFNPRELKQLLSDHRAGRQTMQSATNVLQNYLARMEQPHFAPLNDIFIELAEDKALGWVFYNMTDDLLLASLSPEKAMPVASAFKGPVLLFFLDTVDPAVWNSVPVDYWNSSDATAVPEEYRDAWQKHAVILRNLYNMIVPSDNHAAGRVLAYLADLAGSIDPLALFNDWSHEVVGISHLSAMSSWGYGVPGHLRNYDQRYLGRKVSVNYQLVVEENLMTARDLGLYYAWFSDKMSAEQQRVGRALLSTIQNDRRANIERLAFENGGVAFSKNGSLGDAESRVGAVIVDVGIIQMDDGTEYIIAFLSAGAEHKVFPMFQIAAEVLQGMHADTIAAYETLTLDESEVLNFQEKYMAQVYPENRELLPDLYNYGFVKHEGVSIYWEPDENKPLRNPVISTSRFGVHLLMQGAIVRFTRLNSEWVSLVADTATDNVRTRLGDPIYMKMQDIHPILLEHALPIPHFVDDTVTPQDKFAIIELNKRELVTFEREELLYKIPVILSGLATPRGTYVVMHKWYANSMQPWAPGVPFTTYFHREGYALHGAPWQRWHTSVTTQNVATRTSAGCINIPNWELTIGDYTRPVDELLFRWLGGMLEPERNVLEYANSRNPAVRIYVLESWDEIRRFHLPPGVKWENVLAKIEASALDAPDSYFA